MFKFLLVIYFNEDFFATEMRKEYFVAGV